MIDLKPLLKKESITESGLKFKIPTKISNQQPIFLLNFTLNDNPSVTINLNPMLNIKAKPNQKTIANTFNEEGKCNIVHKFPDNYFIDAELELQPDFSDSKDDNYCKMKINYGKGNSQLYYLKGVFNLNDF